MTTRSFYLGPNLPRLVVESWSDIVTAADIGSLRETHWVELKKDIPRGDGANLELARDLASLSVDGGVLIVGVKDKTHDLVGAEVDGLAERIVKVAADRVSPPLPVTISPPYPNPSDPTKAVLVVTVPASQTAPHMVDHHYWHRNAEGKQVMGDELVRLLLRTRSERAEGFKDRLRSLAREDFDTWPLDERRNGHLYLLAEPATARVPIPLDQADTDDLQPDELWSEVLGGVQPLHGLPTLRSAQSRVPHPDGVLMASWDKTIDPNAQEANQVRVLMRNDGVVMVVAGAAVTSPSFTGSTRSVDLGVDPGAELPRSISLTGHVGPLVHTCCVLISHMASKYLAYNGEWRIGVRIDKMHRCLPNQYGGSIFRGFQAFEYLDETGATTDELTTQPGEVTLRLLRRLARGLGATVLYAPLRLPPRE